MAITPAPSGLLLVGHGTDDKQGQAAMLEVSQQVARLLPDVAVEPACLELSRPTISEAIATLAAHGVHQLTAVPVLLFAAGHVKRDIPLAVEQAAREHRIPHVRMAPHLGCHPAVVRLSTERFLEAVPKWGAIAKDETLLLFVGRGSRDPEANSDLAKFARLRWEQTPVGWLETCYLAMTQPTLADGLRFASSLPYRRIVVQPHLLFSGVLANRVAEAIDAARREHPGKEWILVGPLGTGEQIAQVIVEQGLGGRNSEGSATIK
ncbi:MAG: sirohydrochlorin chelatase [Planctomycetes bacterium]|nr:sirohydrochlorin chelatase [Planctomycetota bacterium]